MYENSEFYESMIELCMVIINYECNEYSKLNIKIYEMLINFTKIYQKNIDCLGFCLEKLITQLAKEKTVTNNNNYNNAKKEQTKIIECLINITEKIGEKCLIFKNDLKRTINAIVKTKIFFEK